MSLEHESEHRSLGHTRLSFATAMALHGAQTFARAAFSPHAKAMSCAALLGALTFASGASASGPASTAGSAAPGMVGYAALLAGAGRAPDANLPNSVLPARDGRGITLRLQHDVFDPLVRPAAIPSGLTISSPRGEYDYYLVQFAEPITERMRDSLLSSGVTIEEYIPDFAFIVKARPQSIQAVSSLTRWSGLFQPAFRLDKTLVEMLPAADAGRTVDVAVRMFRGESERSLRDVIESSRATVLSTSPDSGGGEVLYLRVPEPTVRDLAFVSDVAWIEPARTYKFANEIARSDIAMRKDYVEANVGLYGANQGVAVGDTGVSTGNPATVHADFLGRIIGGTTGPGSTCGGWADNYSHGTHVAGSVLGNGTEDGSVPANHDYAGTNAGIAPEALLYAWGFCNDFSGLPDDLYAQYYGVVRAADPRVRISTNSWGSTTGSGLYNIDSRNSDRFLFDNPDMVILFAAGNDGVDNDSNGVVNPNSIKSPGTAKNVITVGASENFRLTGGYNPGGDCDAWGDCWPSDYPAPPIQGDLLSNNINGMAAFSGRGPINDGRLKPDVVAPGSNIVSTRYEGSETAWGVYDADYIYMGGTSMATPLVAGATAVLREFYQTQWSVPSPSGALLKATLINGAFDMSPGQYGAGATQDVLRRPDINQGWGRVDLRNSAMYEGPRGLWFHEATPGLATAGTYTATIEVLDGSVPLRASLVWSDKEGTEVSFGALVNDLDLVVEAPNGDLYYGNDALDGLADGDLDRVNPLEGVDITAPALGDWTFTVTGFNVPQGPQPFALVVSGGIPKPPFRVTADPGTFEVCAGTNAVYDVDAVLDVVSFTDPVVLSASGNPAPSTTAFSLNNQPAPFSSVLTIGNTGSVAPGSYPIVIDAISGVESSQANVNLSVVGAAPAAFNLASPANGASGVSLLPTLSWTASTETTEYLVEVATDAGFNDIVFSEIVAGTSAAPSLEGSTQYYWRVTASNVCDDTPSTAAFSFTTVNTVAAQMCFNTVTPIQDNNTTGVTTQVVFPPDTGAIVDLDLRFVATHTYVGDLKAVLTKVGGPTITPLDRPGFPATTFGCSSNNPNLVLDDEGTLGPAETGCSNTTGANAYTNGGRYTPNAPLSGLDGTVLGGTWQLTVSDNFAGDTGSITQWCIEALVEAPTPELTAVDDDYDATEDTLLTVVVADGVLDNDTTTGPDPITTATQVAGPTNGDLTLNPDGSFTYDPDTDACGIDTFTYTATDGTLVSEEATVTIDVECVDDTPVAVNDSYDTDEDVTLTVAAAQGVLSNDTTQSQNPITTATLVAGPANGDLTLNPDGSFTYVPEGDVCGVETFTYTAGDGTNVSAAATVTLDVACLPDAPVATNDDYTTDEGEALTVLAAAGVLVNDTDADADTLTATSPTAAANGSVLLNANGSFTYTPDAEFCGVDSFTYEATDGTLNSAAATVTITVTCLNVAPVAGVIDDLTVLFGTAVDLPAGEAFSDADGDTLAFSQTGLPATLSIDPVTGEITGTPGEADIGSYPITVTAEDPDGETATASFTLTVVGLPLFADGFED